MLLEALRTEVYEANLEIVRRGLVLYTFGNASGISRSDGLIVIKPSGVPYEKMSPGDLVITDPTAVVEGTLRPSSIWPRTRPLSCIPVDWRRSPYTFPSCDRLGAGTL